jgi:hypothetical protein
VVDVSDDAKGVDDVPLPLGWAWLGPEAGRDLFNETALF